MAERLHIVHVWDYFPTELLYHIHYLSDQFTAMGHEVTIIAADKSNPQWRRFLQVYDPPAGESRYHDARLIRLPTWRIATRYFPKRWRSLREALHHLRPDVLHLFGIPRPFTMISAHELPRLESHPALFVNDHSHAMNERKSWVGQTHYAFWNLLYQRLIAPQASRVIVPNQACYECLQQRYSIPTDRLRIIPLGYDSQQFCRRPAQKNQSPKLVVGFAGKIQPAKRVEVLLEAIHRSAHRESMECHIVGETGDAYSQELRSLAARWQLDVQFRPLLKTEQLAEFYNFLDVAVYPGSISITTQEATGCGTPILLYESIPGLEDRVMNGRGHLFREIRELTAHLDAWVARKQRAGIDHAAIEAASRAWSWELVAQQYLSEYEIGLAQRRKQR